MTISGYGICFELQKNRLVPRQYAKYIKHKALHGLEMMIYHLTFYVINLAAGTKHIVASYAIPPHWHDTESWNLSLCETRTYLFNVVNIMGTDVLTAQGARASANHDISCVEPNQFSLVR